MDIAGRAKTLTSGAVWPPPRGDEGVGGYVITKEQRIEAMKGVLAFSLPRRVFPFCGYVQFFGVRWQGRGGQRWMAPVVPKREGVGVGSRKE
jgi:hypothetical protein